MEMPPARATTVSNEGGSVTRLEVAAREFLRQSKAENTVTAYRSDWRHFAGWCAERGRDFLPANAETVVLYLSDLASAHKVSTITRRAVAINQAHRGAGHESPTAAALGLRPPEKVL
jgi:site-specific recombinase XerD